MSKLNELSPAALRAAMEGGIESWGTWGSATEHVLYVEPIGKTKNWRKCHCGCGKRATHRAAANGVTLALGCEINMRRFMKTMQLYAERARAAPQSSPLGEQDNANQ